MSRHNRVARSPASQCDTSFTECHSVVHHSVASCFIARMQILFSVSRIRIHYSFRLYSFRILAKPRESGCVSVPQRVAPTAKVGIALIGSGLGATWCASQAPSWAYKGPELENGRNMRRLRSRHEETCRCIATETMGKM